MVYCVDLPKTLKIFGECQQKCSWHFGKFVWKYHLHNACHFVSQYQNLYVLCSSVFSGGNLERLCAFSWEKGADALKTQCPVLWNALVGATTTKQSQDVFRSKGGKWVLPIVITVAGMLAYARNPRKLKLIQQLIGIQLWLGGLKRTVCIALPHEPVWIAVSHCYTAWEINTVETLYNTIHYSRYLVYYNVKSRN